MDLVHSGCILLRHDMDDKLKAANSTGPSEGGFKSIVSHIAVHPKGGRGLD